MRQPRFYTEQHLSDHAEITLETGPSQHIARTLRMQVGDKLTLFDGSGGEYPGHIHRLDKRSVTVVLHTKIARECESPVSIHLGIGMSRGDRMDWIIQKATELGVQLVSPLTTDRSGLKLTEQRLQKKLEHWQRVAISACEQCGRNRVPAITPIQTSEHWCQSTCADIKLVLHHRTETPRNLPQDAQTVALLVGPEGGLTESEILLAANQGFIELPLGPRVLRTETAPLAAIALLQSRWGDMTLQ